MRFGSPQLLWLFPLLLLFGAFLILAWRKRQRLIREFVQSRLLAALTLSVSKSRQKLRLWLVFAAFTLLLLTLARPQWGFAWEEATRQGLDIVVAIDTSRSMLAEDPPPANRLQRARLAALDLARLARTDRFGLIAFAGSAFLQCPLTLDKEVFRQNLDALAVGIIPLGGTTLSEAINAALGAFEKDSTNHKILVLLTDGEDHDDGAVEAARKAADAGLKIYTIGVGTPEGEMLRTVNENGAIEFLKDSQGNAIKSRLNESLLRQVATVGDGFYLPLRGARTMETLWEQGLAPLPRTDITARFVRRFQERFQWPLAIAIALLIAELFIPDRRKPARSPAPASTDPNAGLRKAVTLLTLLLLPLTASASAPGALRQYQAGRYDEARQEYERLLEERPHDARLHFNAGTAAYRAQDYESALRHFDAALLSPDLGLQASSYYNLGNTLYQAGELSPQPDQQISAWEGALQNYENALELNPGDADAQHNRDLVRKQLEELKQQQQQSQSESGEDSDQDENNDSERDDQGQQQSQEDRQQPGEPEDSQQQNQDEQSSQAGQEQPPDEQQQPRDSQGESPPEPGDQDQQDSSSEGQSGEESTEQSADAAAAQPAGPMTPEQARQLLDAMKNDERALIFQPRIDQPRRSPPIKDW